MVGSWSKLHDVAAPVTHPHVVLAAEDVDVWLAQRRERRQQQHRSQQQQQQQQQHSHGYACHRQG